MTTTTRNDNDALPVRLTDTDKLYKILHEQSKFYGEWISHESILNISRQVYGHGMTVHSRAASLRKKGYDVQCKVETRDGRKVSFYRLVTP